MTVEIKLTDAASIHQQAADKQRIVITGNEAAVITAIITHTLTVYHKKFDLVRNGEYHGDQSIIESDAPIILFEESSRPFNSLLRWHHHIAIVSDINDEPPVLSNITAFADATPKAGVLICSDQGLAGTIGKKPRPDVTTVLYSDYEHKEEAGRLFLITSTNEKYPVQIGNQYLRSLSASKELLKRTGITSSQFYHAMTEFRIQG